MGQNSSYWSSLLDLQLNEAGAEGWFRLWQPNRYFGFATSVENPGSLDGHPSGMSWALVHTNILRIGMQNEQEDNAVFLEERVGSKNLGLFMVSASMENVLLDSEVVRI
eukprot:s18_g29.t1